MAVRSGTWAQVSSAPTMAPSKPAAMERDDGRANAGMAR
jgi:hypothetical protein